MADTCCLSVVRGVNKGGSDDGGGSGEGDKGAASEAVSFALLSGTRCSFSLVMRMDAESRSRA